MNDKIHRALLGAASILGRGSRVAQANLDYAALRSSPSDATETKAELLAKVRRGEHVTLGLNATTFIQRPTPNRNFLRHATDSLPHLSKTAPGRPAQFDHVTRTAMTIGRVEGSDLVTKLSDAMFDQYLSLVDQTAVEMVLDGRIREFSIGWFTPDWGEVYCSVCQEPIFEECWHFPGHKLGANQVEWVWRGAEFKELSVTPVPAVQGTRIDAISRLSALDQLVTLAHELAPKTYAVRNTPQMKTLQEQVDALRAEVARLTDCLDLATKEKEELATQLSEFRGKEIDAEIEAHNIGPALAQHLGEIARRDGIDAIRPMLEESGAKTAPAPARPSPVGRELQSTRADRSPDGKFHEQRLADGRIDYDALPAVVKEKIQQTRANLGLEGTFESTYESLRQTGQLDDLVSPQEQN